MFLPFSIALSIVYILGWSLYLKGYYLKLIKDFDKSKGTQRGDMTIYPPGSKEGRILTATIFATIVWLCAIVNLVFATLYLIFFGA